MDVLFSNILCQDLHPLDAAVGSTWNAGNPVPLHRWLVPTMDEESRQRLKALGNIVILPQANLGMMALSHITSLH